MDVLRDITNPGIYIRKVLKCETDSRGKKKKTVRVHNCYQTCGICNKKVSNFSQHVQRKNPSDIHNKNIELQTVLKMEDKKEQKRHLTLLRNKYNHAANLSTLSEKKGELFLDRRPTEKLVTDNYGPCPHCYAWVVTKALYKHQEHCVGMARQLTTAEIITQSSVLSHRTEQKASPGLVKEVLSIMHQDDIGHIAKSDQLIVMLGNQWLEKNVGNHIKRARYTLEIMRLVARLSMALKQILAIPSLKLWDALRPVHFDHLVKATLMVAAGDMDDLTDLKHPSNARKLGFDIKRLLSLNIGLCIEQGNKIDQTEAEDTLKLMGIFWGTRVAKLANVLLEDRQINRTQSFPISEDLKKLNIHLNTNIAALDLKDSTPENYRNVSELSLVKLMVYNRRRTGDMECCR